MEIPAYSDFVPTRDFSVELDRGFSEAAKGIPMNPRPIHQNLDTSFVNLSALIKYLRRRQFVGSVKIELNGYRADIQLKDKNQISVREHDEISGRISEGKEALQRVMIRTREPGGTINVFQHVRQPDNSVKPRKPALRSVEIKAVKRPAVKKVPVKAIPKPDKAIVLKESHANGTASRAGAAPRADSGEPLMAKVVEQVPSAAESPVEVKPSLPDFPFELSNKYEARARRVSLTDKDWKLMMQLTVEMLGVVDRTLASQRLDFTAAFAKVRSEVAEDYPFLNPARGIFDYDHGRITMTRKINPNIFVASIAKCLEKMLYRLRQNPRFASLNHHLSARLQSLTEKRKPQYDRFGYTAHLRRVLGP